VGLDGSKAAFSDDVVLHAGLHQPCRRNFIVSLMLPPECLAIFTRPNELVLLSQKAAFGGV
jgi:hypothetical protein